MEELIKQTKQQIENTRKLLNKAHYREEVEAHVLHLEELHNKLWELEQATIQKPYLNSINQGSV